jgi:hypothetical protein
MEFESESIFIIISCSSKHIEKRGDGLQVTHTLFRARISQYISTPGFGESSFKLCSVAEQLESNAFVDLCDLSVGVFFLGFNENDFPKSITRQRELRSFL